MIRDSQHLECVRHMYIYTHKHHVITLIIDYVHNKTDARQLPQDKTII